MKEAVQLIWIALGLAVGAAIGFFAFLRIYQVAGEKMAASPGLSVLAVLGLVGGLGVLGGYLATLAVHRAEKSRRKKRDAAKKLKRKRK